MTGEDQSRKPRSAATREIVDELREWSGKMFQKVREGADTLSVKGRLKLDLATLKSKRGVELRRLGAKVFHLAEKGDIEIPGLESVMARIKELTGEIQARERELETVGRTSPGAEDAGDDGAGVDEENKGL